MVLLLTLIAIALLQELVALILLMFVPNRIWDDNDIDSITLVYPFYGIYLMYVYSKRIRANKRRRF